MEINLSDLVMINDDVGRGNTCIYLYVPSVDSLGWTEESLSEVDFQGKILVNSKIGYAVLGCVPIFLLCKLFSINAML